MTKSKKSAQEKEKRQRTNWALFFKLCKQKKSNEQIAKALGWHIDPKSEDPTKRVRAAKSLARTKGIKVGGKLVRLHDAKLRGVAKLKTDTKKKAKAKPQSQLKPKKNDSQTAQKELASKPSIAE